MNTVRINGQDYTSSLSDAEIAFIGNLSLPTTAQTLSGAIAEHETDISTLNSNLNGLFKTKTVTKASSSANYISTGLNNSEYHVLSVYEEGSTAQGVVCTLGATSSGTVMVYMFSATGSAYTGAVTLRIIYTPNNN